MKKQAKQQNGNGNGHSSQRIRIEFTHPTATAVAIAGTFNDWRPDASQMVPLGDGRWLKELALSPGRYEYRLVVDGAWIADPRASETVRNPFGEMNSVLKVKGSG
jgi:1,4-alpha-glucan branching enzyme